MAPERRMPVQVLADHDVVHSGETAEEADVLVRPRHAERGDAIRRQAVDAASVQLNLSRGGPQQSGDQVQERRLTRAVGADQPVHLAIADGERGVIHGAHASERTRHAGERERHARPAARRRKRAGRETRPFGR